MSAVNFTSLLCQYCLSFHLPDPYSLLFCVLWTTCYSSCLVSPHLTARVHWCLSGCQTITTNTFSLHRCSDYSHLWDIIQTLWMSEFGLQMMHFYIAQCMTAGFVAGGRFWFCQLQSFKCSTWMNIQLYFSHDELLLLVTAVLWVSSSFPSRQHHLQPWSGRMCRRRRTSHAAWCCLWAKVSVGPLLCERSLTNNSSSHITCR